MNCFVLALAAHHAHIMRIARHAPRTALRVMHMAAREHAHVIGGIGSIFLQVIEVTALEQNTLYAREALFVQECGIVIGNRHKKAQMGCEFRHFASNI